MIVTIYYVKIELRTFLLLSTFVQEAQDYVSNVLLQFTISSQSQ